MDSLYFLEDFFSSPDLYDYSNNNSEKLISSFINVIKQAFVDKKIIHENFE
jgi:hypothetical protein